MPQAAQELDIHKGISAEKKKGRRRGRGVPQRPWGRRRGSGGSIKAGHRSTVSNSSDRNK
jgi:hypothetical protein